MRGHVSLGVAMSKACFATTFGTPSESRVLGTSAVAATCFALGVRCVAIAVKPLQKHVFVELLQWST